MKLLTKLSHFYDKLLDILAFIACLLIIFTMVGVSVDVFLRFVFNAPIVGMLEITEYAMLYIGMLGAAWLLRINGHVNIDIVINYFNPKARSALNLITSAVCAITCAFIAYWGAVTTWDQFQRGILDIKVLEIPKFTYLVSIPLGFSILVIELLRKTYVYLKKAKEPEAEEKLAF